jgi:RNA polymerase-associated protein RTF1
MAPKKKTKAPPKKKAKAPPKKKKAAAKPKPKPKPKRKERIALPEDSSSEDEDAFKPADDGFDEDFYGDADDREKLEAMNEMEREVILAERRENRERAVERAAMRRRLNQEKKAKKREEAASAVPRQQSSRTQKLQRGKSASKQQSAIEDLKKRRAQARKDSEDEDESEPDVDDSASDDDIDSDADSEEEDRRRRRQQYSDDDSDDGGMDRDGEEEEEKPQTPIELEDFKMIVVGRHSLEKMVHEPYMEAALTGMFVRVSVGQHEQTGTVTYRLCEIIGVVDGTKRYTLGRTKTVRRLNLKYGSSEKVFCMDVVSSKPPENEEFLRWQKQMRKDDEYILSKENCFERGKRYREAKTQAYTEQMISACAAAAAAAAAAARRPLAAIGVFLMACPRMYSQLSGRGGLRRRVRTSRTLL